MRLLVGLGNPGEEYRATRHNVGGRVIDELRRRHGAGPEERRARALVGRLRLGEITIWAARPQTFMNRSGDAVAALREWAGVAPAEILVVCDDLYLDLGRLRLRPRGSHGGHNGLRSIIAALGTAEFPRLRLGVGPAPAAPAHADYVLAPFDRNERLLVGEMVARGADCAEIAVREGVVAAMNRCNRPPAAGEASGATDPRGNR